MASWTKVHQNANNLFVLRLHDGHFISRLYEGKLHVDWYTSNSITHALPVQVYRQTDFTPKRVVVSRLHATFAKFRTGVIFSLRYNNWGELTPVWLAPVWHFVSVPCKQIHGHYRELEWTRAGAKVAPVSCKHPFKYVLFWKRQISKSNNL